MISNVSCSSVSLGHFVQAVFVPSELLRGAPSLSGAGETPMFWLRVAFCFATQGCASSGRILAKRPGDGVVQLGRYMS